MNKKEFFIAFEQQDYAKAAAILTTLKNEEQQNILQELFYEARNGKQPVAVTVLYRQLHESKTFQDFYNAWMPPKEFLKPFKVGDKIYNNFFDGPTRVINAVNFDDSKEIISVGLIWTEEKQFLEEVEKIKKAGSNTMRRDAISLVADKVSSKIYQVKTDTNLGN